MKRTTKFLISAVVAALTFGSLVATQGPKNWNEHYGYHGWHHHHDCYQYDYDEQKAPSVEEEGI